MSDSDYVSLSATLAKYLRTTSLLDEDGQEPPSAEQLKQERAFAQQTAELEADHCREVMTTKWSLFETAIRSAFADGRSFEAQALALSEDANRIAIKRRELETAVLDTLALLIRAKSKLTAGAEAALRNHVNSRLACLDRKSLAFRQQYQADLESGAVVEPDVGPFVNSYGSEAGKRANDVMALLNRVLVAINKGPSAKKSTETDRPIRHAIILKQVLDDSGQPSFADLKKCLTNKAHYGSSTDEDEALREGGERSKQEHNAKRKKPNVIVVNSGHQDSSSDLDSSDSDAQPPRLGAQSFSIELTPQYASGVSRPGEKYDLRLEEGQSKQVPSLVGDMTVTNEGGCLAITIPGVRIGTPPPEPELPSGPDRRPDASPGGQETVGGRNGVQKPTGR